MSRVSDVEALAFQLSVSERATLASKLLDSLPEVLSDEDGGAGEAMRRRDELIADPSIGITMEDIRESMSKRFDL
jgi:putative addiction module component (TIGR02574 family)